MATLNLSIEDQLLQRASARATARGTSLNTLIYNYVKQYADSQISCQQATQRILQLARQSRAVSEQPRWTRDSLYE
ncbi:MAG: hypothetical protein GY862_08605 [Gammaproteobacteria bacterium]|nr:hypothetical protein [Gammaproteobacteria bacterium]